MKRLRRADYEAVLAFVGEIYRVSDLSTFRQRLIRSFASLIPAEHMMCIEVDLRRRQITGVAEPASVLADGRGEVFGQLVHESPLLKSYKRGKGSAVKLSDFVTRSQLHRTALYNECFREVGTEHQIVKGLPGPPGLITAVTFQRSRVDFDERDRLVLNLLRPHLNQGYANAAALTAARADVELIERGVETLRSGMILLTEGTVRSITSRARDLLARYFPHTERREGVLPEPLQRWLALHLGSGGAGIEQPTRPWVAGRDGGRLIVRYLRRDAEGHGLLLLEEQRQRTEPAALEALGLSRREAEVLAWVAEGKTNEETAIILGTSRRTIDKHLEHILRKLGVETRMAAAARAREAPHGG